MIQLPEPRHDGPVSVEQALRRRRSVRDFEETPLSLAEAGQLLWAAHGVTGPDGGTTTPSAGAVSPLIAYLVAGQVDGLEAGIYRYEPESHALTRTAEGDRRAELAGAALGQPWLVGAPVVVLLTARFEATERRYGELGRRFVHMEAGHATQNLQLQATALDLGSVPVAAFEEDALCAAAGLPEGEVPLYAVAVGHA